MSDYLTPAQVAVELQLCETTVYRGLRSGDIPGTRFGSSWRTLRSQLDERVSDGRTPKPRKKAEDPMPRPRAEGRFRAQVIELRRAHG